MEILNNSTSCGKYDICLLNHLISNLFKSILSNNILPFKGFISPNKALHKEVLPAELKPLITTIPPDGIVQLRR